MKIMSKSIKMHFTLDNDAKITGSAHCIRTDAWQDHIGLLEDARSASKTGNIRRSKRFLRASLIFLLAHLESSLTACLLSIQYKGKSREIICGANLPSKLEMINSYLTSKTIHITLTAKDPRDLRNIIAHADAFRSGGQLNEIDLFEKLTTGYLRKTSNDIDMFLNKVCKECAVERFSDTEHELKKIAVALGKIGEIQEI